MDLLYLTLLIYLAASLVLLVIFIMIGILISRISAIGYIAEIEQLRVDIKNLNYSNDLNNKIIEFNRRIKIAQTYRLKLYAKPFYSSEWDKVKLIIY